VAHPDDPDDPTDPQPGDDAPVQGELVGPDPGSGPDLGAVLGGGGFDGLLEQAQSMMAAQAEASETVVEGVAGGGVVRIRVTGGGQVDGVSIAPEVVDPDDVAMLEDLVVAALRDVNEQLGALQREALGGFGDLLGGGSLDDLLGGG
jgi:nucleoid-associated protein EbfC